MENTSHKRIKKITQLALFLAMGIVLNIIESFIPIPIPIPGVKLGLANTIGLVLLYYYSPKEYIGIGFLRVMLVAVLRTGFMSMAFFLSLAGWFLSSLIAVGLYYLKMNSIYGLSVASAVFHGIGQMIVVMLVYNQSGLIIYLPVLMFTGVISGTLTALITSLILSKVDKHINYLIKE